MDFKVRCKYTGGSSVFFCDGQVYSVKDGVLYDDTEEPYLGGSDLMNTKFKTVRGVNSALKRSNLLQYFKFESVKE